MISVAAAAGVDDDDDDDDRRDRSHVALSVTYNQ